MKSSVVLSSILLSTLAFAAGCTARTDHASSASAVTASELPLRVAKLDKLELDPNLGISVPAGATVTYDNAQHEISVELVDGAAFAPITFRAYIHGERQVETCNTI